MSCLASVISFSLSFLLSPPSFSEALKEAVSHYASFLAFTEQLVTQVCTSTYRQCVHHAILYSLLPANSRLDELMKYMETHSYPEDNPDPLMCRAFLSLLHTLLLLNTLPLSVLNKVFCFQGLLLCTTQGLLLVLTFSQQPGDALPSLARVMAQKDEGTHCSELRFPQTLSNTMCAYVCVCAIVMVKSAPFQQTIARGTYRLSSSLLHLVTLYWCLCVCALAYCPLRVLQYLLWGVVMLCRYVDH